MAVTFQMKSNVTPIGIIRDVDDLVANPLFIDPIGDWPNQEHKIHNPAEQYDIFPRVPPGCFRMEMWEEELVVDAETLETVAEPESNHEEAMAERTPLLDRFVYLGENRWYRRSGPTWAKACREHDGAVLAAIGNAGYSATRTMAADWQEDSILRCAPSITSLSERGVVLDYMKEHLLVNEIWCAANWPHGVFVHKSGKRILNRGHFSLVEPKGSILPECWRHYGDGLLGDQRERVWGLWRETLKRAHAGGLIQGWYQPLGLALCSSLGGVGKSQAFRFIALSLGSECPAAAGGYLAGDRIGCSHYLQEPVVELSDASVSERDVGEAQTLLLNLVSNPNKEVRNMRSESRMIPLSPLLCVSLNTDNPECIRIFRRLPVTVIEKWLIALCGNGTKALRAAGFDYGDLERTLPQMVGYLLATDTPEEFLFETVEGRRQPARFLVAPYFDPELDLAWGSMGNLAPVWKDIAAALRAVTVPPKNGRFKVSKLLGLLRQGGNPTYGNLSVKAFAVMLDKIHLAIPTILKRKSISNPKKGGWYEYFT